MERNRQKLVGRDKGSLTEQQTKGTVTTTIWIMRIHKTKQNSQSRSHRPLLPCAPKPRVSSHHAAPPSPEPSMTAHGMEYPALFGQLGSACPAVSLPGFPSWILVKINPVLAKPRTLSTTYSIPSTSCPGLPFPSRSPPLLLSPDIIPLVYGSSL